jgi:hypothetical protein
MASWSADKAEGRRRRQRAWLVLILAFSAYVTFIAARDLLT